MLDSAVALTDLTESITTECIMYPFLDGGAERGDGNPTAFTGREADATGLYYRARYYDPQAQRFLSEDPTGLAGGEPIFYGYVANAPTNAIDPTGTIAWFAPPLMGGVIGRVIDPGLRLLENGGDMNCVSWREVGLSALIGAGAASLGPSGPCFGRTGQRYGAPKWWGNVHHGDRRFGWFWDGTGWGGRITLVRIQSPFRNREAAHTVVSGPAMQQAKSSVQGRSRRRRGRIRCGTNDGPPETLRLNVVYLRHDASLACGSSDAPSHRMSINSGG